MLLRLVSFFLVASLSFSEEIQTCARWRSEGLGVAGTKWVALPALACTAVLSPGSGVGRRDWRSGDGAHPHVARDSAVTYAWR